MPKVNLTHFETTLLFAFLSSIVLGVVSKKTDRDRLYYGLYCFSYFVVAVFVIAWLIKLGHG